MNFQRALPCLLSLLVSAAALCPAGLRAQVPPVAPAGRPAFNLDSLISSNRSNAPADTSRRAQAQPQGDFKSEIKASARDSSVLDVAANILYLYGGAVVEYEAITLKAGIIWVDFKRQELHASGIPVLGTNWKELPEFSDGQGNYVAREMVYNFKTEKGIIKGARTAQADGFVLAEVVKKQDDGSFHGAKGRFTTCDLEHPHFYIQSTRMKVVPDKEVISGPLNLVIEDVPLPIFIPFGFFPTKKPGNRGQQNGLIMPKFGDARDRGFFMRGLGYYLSISDNLDLQVDGDYFTRGGFALRARSNYNWRYRFGGNLSVEYAMQRFGEKTPLFTDPGYSKTQGWRIGWSHNQPISPTARLTASANIATSRNVLRRLSLDTRDLITNTLNSNLSFTKSFAPFNLSVRMSHSQEVSQGTMSATLPDMSLNMQRQQPFRNVKPNASALAWLRQLGFDYNLQATNSLSNVPDTSFFDAVFRPYELVAVPGASGELQNYRPGSDFFRSGIQQVARMNTSVKLMKYVNLNPSFNYTEYTYFKSLRKTWDPLQNQTADYQQRGLVSGRQYDFTLNASSTVYAIYQLHRSRRDIWFRQQFAPNIGLRMAPNFTDPKFGYFRPVQVNQRGDIRPYSIFEGAAYGGPAGQGNQSVQFSLAHVLEMKIKTKAKPDEDEAAAAARARDPYLRMRLLNLNIGSGYNLNADSFALQAFSFGGNANLTPRMLGLKSDQPDRQLLGINFGWGLDPYAVDDAGRPNGFQYAWQAGQGIGRITRANLSLNTSFASKPKQEKSLPPGVNPDEYQFIRNNLDDYVDFDIPWSVSLNYNFNYGRNLVGLEPNITNTLNVSGDFNFTDKWKVRFSTGYDFKLGEVTLSTFSIYRDLHCWEMSINATPFGTFQSYNLAINVRSATLRMLRLTRQNNFQDRRF